MSVRLVLSITDLTREGSAVTGLTVGNIIGGLEGRAPWDAMRLADEVVLVLKSRGIGHGLAQRGLEIDARGSVISPETVGYRPKRDSAVVREIQRAIGPADIDLGPPFFNWTRAVRHLTAGVHVRREVPNDDDSRPKWRVLPSEPADQVLVSDITARDWMVVPDTE